MNKAVLGVIDDFSDEPWFGDQVAPTSTSTSTITTEKKSLTDKISDWLNLAKEGASVVKSATSNDGSVTYVVPNTVPPANQSNTMKYVLIGGGVALAVTAAAILIARTGARKKKALGAVKEKKGKKRS